VAEQEELRKAREVRTLQRAESAAEFIGIRSQDQPEVFSDPCPVNVLIMVGCLLSQWFGPTLSIEADTPAFAVQLARLDERGAPTESTLDFMCISYLGRRKLLQQRRCSTAWLSVHFIAAGNPCRRWGGLICWVRNACE
jgi:hypothetical protein